MQSQNELIWFDNKYNKQALTFEKVKNQICVIVAG